MGSVKLFAEREVRVGAFGVSTLGYRESLDVGGRR